MDVPTWKVVEVKLETETRIVVRSSGGAKDDKPIDLDVTGEFGSIKNKKQFAKMLCEFLNKASMP